MANLGPEGSKRDGKKDNTYNSQKQGKKYTEVKDTRFVNPYNFIPMEKACVRESPNSVNSSSFTGYFDCSLRLLTHLFIPNTSSSRRLVSKNNKIKKNQQLKDDQIKADEQIKDKDGAFKGYDFFSYDDFSDSEPYDAQIPPCPKEPVIPGSEIRGVVRSVYEAAFNGCMSSVDEERDISRRIIEIKEAGILRKEKNGWFLTPCKRARLPVQQKDGTKADMGKKKSNRDCQSVNYRIYDSWKEGQEIWFKVNERDVVTAYKICVRPEEEKELKDNNYVKGYLHKGEYISKKGHESVFYSVDSMSSDVGRVAAEKFPVSPDDIELFRSLMSQYRDAKKNKIAKDGKWYNEYGELKDRTLVYYTKLEGGSIYLSPACIGKEVFVKKLSSLLEINGGYQPCSGVELCPACQIFGMVGKAEKPRKAEKAEKPEKPEKPQKPSTYAYGSKVRITDAKLADPHTSVAALFEDPVILPEMGEPRPSAVEFYTQMPYHASEKNMAREGKGFWTYDYKYEYIMDKGKKTPVRTVLDENQPIIRGRKYYWHHEPKIQDYKKDDSLNAMKQRIRPMKPVDCAGANSVFKFRVYFEQLSKKQLHQLMWTMDFGDPDCAHKLGRGKPLGFGSVQI